MDGTSPSTFYLCLFNSTPSNTWNSMTPMIAQSSITLPEDSGEIASLLSAVQKQLQVKYSSVDRRTPLREPL